MYRSQVIVHLWVRVFVVYVRHVCNRSRSLARPVLARVFWAAALLLPFPPAVRQRASPDTSLPRVVWMYWADGEAKAPGLVRYCIRSWREMNPEWDVRVLDDVSVPDFADLGFIPSNTRVQLVADVLRVELLRRHGGVWADATCLCTRPLDEWLLARMSSGFFAFERPGRDRVIANWFLASVPNGDLISAWYRSAHIYWSGDVRSNHVGPNGRLDQFIHHYLFEWMIRADGGLRGLWRQTPSLPAGPPHHLQAWLKDPTGDVSLRARALAALADPDVPVHKLDWRIADGESKLREALAAFLSQHPQPHLQWGRAGPLSAK